MLNVLAETSINFSSCGLSNDAIVLANLVKNVITIIKVFIPIALILYGMLDLGKAVMSNDEKTMKEAQGKLIKRFLYAILVFLIVALVQVAVGFVSKAGAKVGNANKCITCFVNGVNKETGKCN